MKANRHAREHMDDEGAMGIGAMIVFIAMVIVAAVAAAVLINTAGNLQRKSLETGKESQQEVAGNLFIRDIVGYTNATSSQNRELREVYFYLSLAPGGDPIDLNQVIVRWTTKDTLQDVEINATAPEDCNSATWTEDSALADGFCIRTVKDGGDNDPSVLGEGDKVRLEVHLNQTNGERVGTRENVDVLIIPEVGSPVIASFKTPATYGNRLYHSLL